MKRRSSMRRSVYGILLLVGLAVAPAVLVTRSAIADQDDDGSDEPAAQTSAQPKKGAAPVAANSLSQAQFEKRRSEVLRTMVEDDAVLINVARREMPASPDILNLGRKSARALARCVSDNVDDELRAFCAALLGRMGDRAGLVALQGAVEAWDPAVRRAAIIALRKMPDRSSTAHLMKVLEREDEEPSNRQLALEALGMLSDPKAMPVLVRELRDEKVDVGARAAAFRGVWKSRHLVPQGQLASLVSLALRSDSPDLALAGTFAASELRSPELVEPLTRLIQSSDVRVRNRAVYALGKIGSPAATKTLLTQLPKVRESRMLNNMAFALERLDPRAFYSTAEGLIGHKQAQIRMNAAFVLGDVRRPEGLRLLTTALADQNQTVKLSAVTALGKLEAPDAAKVLERYVDDPDPTLSRAAIYAIYAQSGDTRTDLVHDRLFANPSRPEERLEAALALGRANDPRALPELLGCLERRACKTSDVAPPLLHAKTPEIKGRALLAWVKGRPDLGDLVAELRPPSAAALAVSEVQAEIAQKNLVAAGRALDLSGDLGDDEALAVLRPLLTHESATLRLHAAVALARAGHAPADEVLWREIDNRAHDSLPPAAKLLGRVSEPPARTRLLPELVRREQGSDADVALACAAAHLAWDPEAAIFRMLDALASPARLDRDLAELYLRKDERPVVTELLRRALARENRDIVKGQLRKILDLRAPK